ncbi:LysR family transcriptional regulator [Patulibacter defluvii]|uniref:LysR family transcriptional regulator n=1 Tax=Patulibacter defluvii TaxID=3095358 RepID=UPI002A74A781|nr:LysR family transcriptional regulator [Patulibacter sp. DM4]
MELQQLRYLAEVRRRGSFTAAAEALHVSQPGVSAQVAKLERELGVRLFDRGARVATLTPEGQALLPHATAALDAVGRIRTVADDLAGVTRGQVRIGTVIGCTIPGYLRAFAGFRKAHPGVAVTASEGNSDDLIAALAAGDLDVALVAHAVPLPADFDVVTVVDEPLAAAVPRTHPWAGRIAVPPAALAEQDVLTLPPGTGVRAALATTCAAAGVDLVPAVQVHSPEAALALAAEGAGVAVLSPSMIAAPLVAVAIEGAARTALSLATRAEPGAAARAFAAALRGGLTAGR